MQISSSSSLLFPKVILVVNFTIVNIWHSILVVDESGKLIYSVLFGSLLVIRLYKLNPFSEIRKETTCDLILKSKVNLKDGTIPSTVIINVFQLFQGAGWKWRIIQKQHGELLYGVNQRLQCLCTYSFNFLILISHRFILNQPLEFMIIDSIIRKRENQFRKYLQNLFFFSKITYK